LFAFLLSVRFVAEHGIKWRKICFTEVDAANLICCLPSRDCIEQLYGDDQTTTSGIVPPIRLTSRKRTGNAPTVSTHSGSGTLLSLTPMFLQPSPSGMFGPALNLLALHALNYREIAGHAQPPGNELADSLPFAEVFCSLSPVTAKLKHARSTS